jgi:hypothetical protein
MFNVKLTGALALILSVSLFAASAQAAVGKSGYTLRKQAAQETLRSKEGTARLAQDEKQDEAKKSVASARDHKSGIRR